MTNKNEIKLVFATMEDALFLYQLRTTEDVIVNSVSKAVFTFEDHQKWLQNIMIDNNHILYIAQILGKNVGYIRIDKMNDNNEWEISLAVDNHYRMKGVGHEMIEIIKRIHSDKNLFAKVLGHNSASLCLFKRCGFVMISESDEGIVSFKFNK